jgi:hypothetical protein
MAVIHNYLTTKLPDYWADHVVKAASLLLWFGKGLDMRAFNLFHDHDVNSLLFIQCQVRGSASKEQLFVTLAA